MAQVDSENTTAMPARAAGAINPSGLAKQQRDRERALKRLARLKARAAAEIDRLLTFLDAVDPYVTTELEENGDDEDSDPGEDDGTAEYSLGFSAVVADVQRDRCNVVVQLL